MAAVTVTIGVTIRVAKRITRRVHSNPFRNRMFFGCSGCAWSFVIMAWIAL